MDRLLAPLVSAEIDRCVRLLQRQHGGFTQLRKVVHTLVLKEPEKSLVLEHMRSIDAGGSAVSRPPPRRAFGVLLDRDLEQCIECVIELSEKKESEDRILSWAVIPGAQPGITPLEYELCEALVKDDTRVQEALQARGLHDMERIMVDVWAPGRGYRGDHEAGIDLGQMRVAKPLLYLVDRNSDNPYARPIKGIQPVVDLHNMKVLRVMDFAKIPVPTESGIFGSFQGPKLKPLVISQPQGPSFTVRNHQIEWASWRFGVGFSPREGVVLQCVRYQDPGSKTWRPILYRASLSEMVVPYGDPSRPAYRKNAFDVGEEGIGVNLNSLRLGCDCLGDITYLDAAVCNSNEADVIPNAICLHEEDAGLLYKHTPWRDSSRVHTARSRRFVLSCVSTIANYDYGFVWYFYLDGRIEWEAKLTGVVSTEALSAAEPLPKSMGGSAGPFAFESAAAPNGTHIGRGIYAPIHQHFFTVRIDMMVDGLSNWLYEVNTVGEEPHDEHNPQANAFRAESTLLATEKLSKRHINSNSNRFWLIANHKATVRGYPVAYAFKAGHNTVPMLHDSAPVMQRATHLRHSVAATPYKAKERYPAGEYPNQSLGGKGLTEWMSKNRDIAGKDLVLWYTCGMTHVVRPEEWPVMPVTNLSFELVPFGFFARNPCMYLDETKAETAVAPCCSKL